MGITKTDFMRGMQCRKMLWLDKHRPDLRVIPPETQARLDAGNDFGDRAMGMFGPFEEMTVYRPGTRIPDKKKMAEKTKQHLHEVKNAAEVREQFIKDAGFQVYIIGRCGVRIGKVFIVIHGPDEENPFVPVDVTEEARSFVPWVNEHIWDLNRMQKQREEVAAEPGAQCTCPYECWYYGYCHGSVPPKAEQITMEGI